MSKKKIIWEAISPFLFWTLMAVAAACLADVLNSAVAS
jgi:hypothetical protein